RAVPVRRAGRTAGRARRQRYRTADGRTHPRPQRGRQPRPANPHPDPGTGTVSGMSVVYVGSYGSGISTFARDGARLTLLDRVDLVRHTGSGADPDRQAGPHAHEVRLAGDLVVVVDLGLDRLIGYRLDPATGALTVAADPFARTHAGAGPRHAVAHPNGRWYV